MDLTPRKLSTVSAPKPIQANPKSSQSVPPNKSKSVITSSKPKPSSTKVNCVPLVQQVKNSSPATAIYERTVSHKSTSTPKIQKQTTISSAVIVFNTEESSSPSLESRRVHDISIWDSICKSMELKCIKAVNIHRLSTKTPGSNRPLKVELENIKALERVLLSIPLLDKTKWGNVFIKRDIPWTEREKIRKQKESDGKVHPRNSVIARGIPESPHQSHTTSLAHDAAQWEFLKHTLTDGQVLATSVVRLPRPNHLSALQQPRLLRITLATEEMANNILELFEQKRRLLDPEIKIHLCRPRVFRVQQRQTQCLPNLHPILNISPISISTPTRSIANSKAITPEKKK